MSTGYQLKLTNSYRFTANRETVRLFDAAGVPVCTVVDAKRLMQDLAERAPAGGVYLQTPIDFRLPAENVTSGIFPGFLITDADNLAYVVQECDPPSTYNTAWKCYCLALMALKSTLQIKPPTDSTDAFTSPITTQEPYGSPLTAGINEKESEYVEFQHKKGFRRHFVAWVMQQIPFLPLGSLVVDQNGQTYVVDAVRHKSRLDELTELELRIDP